MPRWDLHGCTPTRKPSMFGFVISSLQLSGVTLPPYWIRICQSRCGRVAVTSQGYQGMSGWSQTGKNLENLEDVSVCFRHFRENHDGNQVCDLSVWTTLNYSKNQDKLITSTIHSTFTTAQPTEFQSWFQFFSHQGDWYQLICFSYFFFSLDLVLALSATSALTASLM